MKNVKQRKAIGVLFMTMIFITALFIGCQDSDSISSKVVYHAATHEIKYSYYHYIPASALHRHPVRVLLSGHGNPRLSYSEMEDYVKDNVINYRLKPYVDDYGYALIVMVVPGGAQYMKRDNMFRNESIDEYSFRPDLEFVKVIDDFMNYLTNQGYLPHTKVFMTGFSNGGLQTNRFSLLHPDKVAAAAIGAAGLYVYPTESWEGIPINYPIGTADIFQLDAVTYSLATFKTIPHYIFVGEEDTDPYNDAVFTLGDRHGFYKSHFGETSAARVPIYAEYLQSIGMQATSEMYPGIGHQYTPGMLTSIFTFFESVATD